MPPLWFGRARATLCLANKNYSAWSFRAWLAVRWAGMACHHEVVIPMRTPEWESLVAPWSPTHRMPALHLEDVDSNSDDTTTAPAPSTPGPSAVVIHDSLAITHTAVAAATEHANQQQQHKALLSPPLLAPDTVSPLDAARGLALACEMHSGFPLVREYMPFNIVRMQEPRPPGSGPGARAWSQPLTASLQIALDAELQRLQNMWRDCRTLTAQRSGDSSTLPKFLLGDTPSLADLMFVPVATRLVAYDVALEEGTAEYVVALLGADVVDTGMGGADGAPFVAEYIAEAQAEEWVISDFEV